MSELRRHVRKALKVGFSCREETGAGELVFDSADVSLGGAFLVSDVLLEQGEVLSLAFSLPDGASLRCTARIAWVRRFPARGEEPGMGVEFTSLTEFDQRALESFLER